MKNMIIPSVVKFEELFYMEIEEEHLDMLYDMEFINGDGILTFEKKWPKNKDLINHYCEFDNCIEWFNRGSYTILKFKLPKVLDIWKYEYERSKA